MKRLRRPPLAVFDGWDTPGRIITPQAGKSTTAPAVMRDHLGWPRPGRYPLPPMTNAFDVLTQRGFVQDATDPAELRDLLAGDPITFYYGADPTSSSLHIGNLVGIMAMAWLQRAGHRPIAVAGGGTGRIGDPSFRDDERPLLDEPTLARNLARIGEQLGRIIDLSSPERGMVVDNYSWLAGMDLIGFLRDVGKHFSVNQMISRESVRRRLEQREHGISFTEFSYQLLQAYDFAHLYAAEGCRLQIGGSDQWGNITAGIDLTRRLHGAKVYGIVWPLIERSDGKKFSKSGGEAVWLAADETSPFAFYQWFLNVPDADVGRFLKLFTFLPVERAAELEGEQLADPANRPAQRALAEEATRIVHGDEGLASALRASAILFGDEPFAALDERTLADAFAEAPSASIPRQRLTGTLGVLDLMVACGAAGSNGEARRLISQGGVRLNNAPVTEPASAIGPADLLPGAMVVLRVGKKRYFLAKFV